MSEIGNRKLRKKIAEIVEDPKIEINQRLYSGLPTETSPASLSRHHSYPKGLIEHLEATAEIALALCTNVEAVYGGKVNRDLVLAGVLLHDIFKPVTYDSEEENYLISRLGERLDHLTLITSELIRRGFSLDLIHIVCAHHGGQSGPMWPRTVEALICHLADQTDSQFNSQISRATKYLLRKVKGDELALITSKEAFEIINSKSTEGWEGVRKSLEKIKRERRAL
ncbi:MAG: HD domain-containing protein [Candidatus Bathyarchaeota archaeon]|nr:HD domain-containing protein [Candidatus Bathyarchaeota archaeon]